MNSAHSKDELCSFKTVGVVTSGRSKMAVILYIYKYIYITAIFDLPDLTTPTVLKLQCLSLE